MQVAMSSKKVKSLFKGLRSISQVFEGEKEEEMLIGNPTDVKHVAHIGWDGPSDNSAVSAAPSWMNEFKSSPGAGEDDSSVKCQSENGGRSRDLPKLPKSTRKSSSEKVDGFSAGENSDKPKRRTSRKASSRSKASSGSGQEEDSSLSQQQSVGLPEIPKKTRRKKSREGSNGGSSRSSRSSKTSEVSDYMSDGSVTSMSQFEQDKNGF